MAFLEKTAHLEPSLKLPCHRMLDKELGLAAKNWYFNIKVCTNTICQCLVINFLEFPIIYLSCVVCFFVHVHSEFFPFEKHEKKTMIKRIFKRENIVATLDTLETLPFCRVLRLGKRKFYYNSCGIIWCVWFSGGDFNVDFYYTWWYLAANWDRYLDVGKLLLGFRVCPLL